MSDKQAAEAKARTPVPDLDDASVSFGNIKHLPRYDSLPAAYQEFYNSRLPSVKFVENWFYSGVRIEDFPPPREGVDAIKARRALSAILRSFAPKQEHKICGAGFLANEWFDFDNVEARSKKDQSK